MVPRVCAKHNDVKRRKRKNSILLAAKGSDFALAAVKLGLSYFYAVFVAGFGPADI